MDYCIYFCSKNFNVALQGTILFNYTIKTICFLIFHLIANKKLQ